MRALNPLSCAFHHPFTCPCQLFSCPLKLSIELEFGNGALQFQFRCVHHPPNPGQTSRGQSDAGLLVAPSVIARHVTSFASHAPARKVSQTCVSASRQSLCGATTQCSNRKK